MQAENAPTVTCDSIFCKEDYPFDILAGLLEDFLAGKVALFVGGGISTENREVLLSRIPLRRSLRSSWKRSPNADYWPLTGNRSKEPFVKHTM